MRIVFLDELILNIEMLKRYGLPFCLDCLLTEFHSVLFCATISTWYSHLTQMTTDGLSMGLTIRTTCMCFCSFAVSSIVEKAYHFQKMPKRALGPYRWCS